jgi:hypothetical protein
MEESPGCVLPGPLLVLLPPGVCDDLPVDHVGQPPFEAAHGLQAAFALGALAAEVGVAVGVVEPRLAAVPRPGRMP